MRLSKSLHLFWPGQTGKNWSNQSSFRPYSLIILLLILFSFGYSGERVNLSLDLVPGKEELKILHCSLKGKDSYAIYCRLINNPGIEIEYALDDSIFKLLTFNTKIFEGVMPKTGEKEITMLFRLLAPFTLLAKEYLVELELWTSGNIKFEIEGHPKNYFGELGEPGITLNYFLKDRIKAGEEIKAKGTLEITGETLTKGIIKLRLPQEVIYQKNSFRFNGVYLEAQLKNNLLLFEIEDIEPGIYNFEYTIFTKPWIASKIIFVGMGMDAWFDQKHIECAEIVRWLFLEPDIFYEGGIILGRVYDKEKKGIKGVSLFLEDGTRSQTDEEGRYSFRWIRPGRHIVSLRNYNAVVDLAPGAVYLLDFEIEPGRIGPKREYIFLGLGEVEVSGIKRGVRLEELPIDAKLTLYFIGEIEGGLVISGLVNTEARDFSELQYLINLKRSIRSLLTAHLFNLKIRGNFILWLKRVMNISMPA